MVETAFHRLLFYAESPGTPFPDRPAEHTAFDVPLRTEESIDLTAGAFAQSAALWTHPVDYDACQSLEDLARAEGLEVIRYRSVRDPEPGINVAVLTCAALAVTAPVRQQSWRLWLNPAGVHAVCEPDGVRFSISPAQWQADPRLTDFNWARG
jgi:hypothetical protein